MRPGPPRGDSISLELTVTADLAEHVVPGGPAVCTAPALLATAERVAHRLLADHLEPGEVATPVAVDVTLRSPLPVGTEVVFVATVASVTQTQLVCEILVRRGATIAARGSIEHRVVDGRVYAEEVASATPTATA